MSRTKTIRPQKWTLNSSCHSFRALRRNYTCKFYTCSFYTLFVKICKFRAKPCNRGFRVLRGIYPEDRRNDAKPDFRRVRGLRGIRFLGKQRRRGTSRGCGARSDDLVAASTPGQATPNSGLHLGVGSAGTRAHRVSWQPSTGGIMVRVVLAFIVLLAQVITPAVGARRGIWLRRSR